MWITHREIRQKFFFHTAGGSRFTCSQGHTRGQGRRFHNSVPRLRTT
jgi:hypothetical protein